MACLKAQNAALASIGVLVASLLVACSPQETPPPVIFVTLPPLGTPTPGTASPTILSATLVQTPLQPTPDPSPSGVDQHAITAAAISQLADDLGVAQSDISFVSIAPSQW